MAKVCFPKFAENCFRLLFFLRILALGFSTQDQQLFQYQIMSSQPRRTTEIESEIQKRITPQNLTANDLDFYIRKTRRLENDNVQLIDELNKVRIRLRRAQDFEIKYQGLINQQSSLKKDIQARDKAYRDLKALNEKLTQSVEQRSNKHEQWGQQKRSLLEEIEKWTLKAEQNEIRRVREVAAEKAKSEEAIKRQTTFIKKDLEDRQQQYKFQIRQLKKIVHEKETVEGIVTGRVEKIRKEKDQQISRLINVNNDEKQQRAKSIEQKNEEISRLKQKFERMINFQLENIKKNLEDQGQIFSIQLNGLKEIIAIKNDEITKLLEQIKRQATEHKRDRDSLLAEAASLKEQIYKIEREGQLELYSLRQKLITIQAADLRDLQKRYAELIQVLRADKAQLQVFLKQKQRQRQQDKKGHQRNIHELQDKLKERENRISMLLDRIKDSGELNVGQLKNLHESFHKIELQKESLTSEYQTNINFMTQQIAKLTTTNQVKNVDIKKLQQELHETKLKFQEDLKEFDLKMKNQRSQFQQQKERDRRQRQRLSQTLASAEREFKNAERRLTREKEKEEREKNKLKFIVQQLQRDVDRLNKYIKSLDQNLKNQYKKSQMNILDTDGSRREGVSRLQKQRVQLQALKHIQIDQIKRKYQMDTTKVVQENEKIKTDLLNKSIALEKAEAQIKKLDYEQRNIEKINREKLVDYQKKMATLNSQINLTQQLYQAFMEAKARTRAQ